MALITIAGKKDPIEIENYRAKKIKDYWGGYDGFPKAEPHEVIDLGFIQFTYGQIKIIEMTREIKVAEDYNRPLTQQERKNRDEMMAKVRKNLEQKGIIKPKKDDKLHISRRLERAEHGIL